MAYDNFENTPFDLNHDGHIDSNEAAYIYDTFYNEDADVCDNVDDLSFGGEWYPSAEERRKQNAEIEQLRRRVQESDRNKKLIFIGIMFALGIFFPNKGIAVILIIAVYVLATMFDVFS